MASREEVDSRPGPEALAQEKELLALLAEMIQMLPGTYRQILDLRLYQGLSSRQTAERPHSSRSAVSTRLSRAVRLFKGRLDAACGRYLPKTPHSPEHLLCKKIVINLRFDCL